MKSITLLFACLGFCVAVAGAEPFKISGLPKDAQVSRVEIGNHFRVSNQIYAFAEIPAIIKGLEMVTIPRGDEKRPGASYSVTINQPATVYVLVVRRGKPAIPEGWEKIDTKVIWSTGSTSFQDVVYTRKCEAGKVEIFGHNGRQGNTFGVPNVVLFKPEQ